MSANSLKEGQKYNAVIISSLLDKEEALNLKFSHPMQIQVSPFVRGSVAFNQLEQVTELAKFGSQIIQSKKYFVGQIISATYVGRGQFSLLEKPITKKNYKKGELVAARYVKHVAGRGVTVQISDNVFGFIEMCEITDEISGNVIRYLSEKSIFAARVIDTDKNGKL